MRYTRALIYEQNLRHNFRQIRKIADGCTIVSLVKANAYGHGLLECAKILSEEGTHFLGVAFPEEAVKIRKSGIDTPILVLVSSSVEDVALFPQYDLHTIGVSLEYLKLISDEAVKINKKVKTHLFINTGMNRDGIRPETSIDFLEKAARMKGIEIVGVCSHFATSDEKDTTFAKKQIKLFNETLSNIKNKRWDFQFIHMANSAAIINFPEAHFNMVRPGISLYGYNTSKLKPGTIDLKPVMKLITNVALIRNVKPGESVGYGRKFFSDKGTNIAIVPIGYGDGLSYQLTNKAQCLIGTKRYNFVGSICMDESMIDIGNNDIGVGDEVVIIGSQDNDSIFADEIAEKIGTIPYEILTAIQDRVPRIVL